MIKGDAHMPKVGFPTSYYAAMRGTLCKSKAAGTAVILVHSHSSDKCIWIE